MTSVLLAALAATWLVLAVAGWLVYLSIRQYGRALLRQDALEHRLASTEQALKELAVQVAALSHRPHGSPALPEGLPLGSQAPDFSLANLEGRQRSLRDFLGQPLLVAFFSPGCGFCLQMAPRLGRLRADGPRVLLIGSGPAEPYRRLAEEHAWTCEVVLDPSGAVMRAYQVTGTPTGYLLDAEGHIASSLAIGADALFRLAPAEEAAPGAGELTAASLRDKEQTATQRARAAGLGVRDSRLPRNGLPAGTPAPGFTLPDLAGVPRSLTEFVGTRTLLVFSDPECGPCQALAPRLTELHERHRDNNLNIVLIGRGDPEANRAKAREHGFTFPVLLQQHWEISKQYAMFATPVGYLIDEHGIIARDVAVGASAILELV